jgi:hypothetical protein
MEKTVFKCSRCGYENDILSAFKRHLARKTECKPKQDDIPEQRKKVVRKQKLRNFGSENIDFIKKEFLKQYIQDPLKGIQEIIKLIYFNQEHDENRSVRTTNDENVVEIYKDEAWHRMDKDYIYNKMIYFAAAILEYNVYKKDQTPEFQKFINSMGEMDNDDLLDLIREEVDGTIADAERHLSKHL